MKRKYPPKTPTPQPKRSNVTLQLGSMRLRVFLILSLAASCSSDKPNAVTSESAHEKKAKALARGYTNANAMIDNAKLCEPEAGTPSLAACERACGLNHSNSCANWAALVEASDAALALYERACKGGSGIGCEGAAVLIESRGVDAAAFYLDARRYHRIHCSQGYARSCDQLATLFTTTKGGPQMPEAALSFRNQACALGRESSCR